MRFDLSQRCPWCGEPYYMRPDDPDDLDFFIADEVRDEQFRAGFMAAHERACMALQQIGRAVL